ncbi:DsbA family oxidoreductase [Sphingomonas sp.]|uniref:DsbA family oxidoreductase n=1 Tax=Sphingomonas sp. TaxID=28214 RepID=UPI0035C7D0F0
MAAVTLSVDIVSDVVCPWCVIGLLGLERAVAAGGDAFAAEIRLQPFELNPDMPAGGQDMREHVLEKYGAVPAGAGERIRTMAARLGFDMPQREGGRIYNTFDAHRLLHWAADSGRQIALQHALFAAYFQQGRNPGDRSVLVEAAGAAGLDPAAARQVIESGEGAKAVRAAEAQWRGEGIASVPTVIVDDRYLIQGAQEPEIYERALRRIAAERTA